MAEPNPTDARDDRDRPHIILINTDQQRFDTVNALGADHMDTPNLDRMVEEGVSFTDCHITAPSCAPSRASLFTGYYPHTTGVLKNGDTWRHSWVEDLHDAGYYTVNVGKMHTSPFETEMGFEERYVVENKDRYLEGRYYQDEWDKALAARGLVKQQREFYRQWEDYEDRLGAFEWELPKDAHPDVFVGELATRWLDTNPMPDGPLFLEIGFPGPHPPYDPTPEAAEPYLDRDLPEPIRSEADLASQPPPFKAMREHNERVDHDSVVHQVEAPADARHRQRAYYYGNVSMIDEQVGQIMDALEANGYLDDAVVIFTSDHGDALGDHGHSQKWTMYDPITRVPTIVRAPDRFEGDRRLGGLCQLMDLGPTVLELADVPIPDEMAAESLLPALRGEDWSGRDVVFAEHARDAILQETAFMTMVRTEDWKLVHFLDEPSGQLFDLNADPQELDNLWDDSAYEDVKQELLAELLEWRVRTGVRTSDWGESIR